MKKIKGKLTKAAARGKEKVANIGGASNEEPSTSGVPRITNETVAEHREEVLSSARKYIYPLQHSKHRIVIISVSLFVLAVVLFFSYTLLALYKFQATSTFIYRVTQVLPFPAAKAGPSFVAYENYLFEVRRYIHYYETQQDVDFNSESGKQQLADFQKRALENVINEAYVKRLAKENNISVSRTEVNDQIELLRSQNRLGSSNQVLEDVLQEFWGWSIADFRRELEQQLLAQKVVAKLDTETRQQAEAQLTRIKAGADFAEVAKKVSEDEATKDSGGEYGFTIERSNRDLPPSVMKALFSLKPGQVSQVIQTPIGLEIVKVSENKDGKVQASHILFRFESITKYVDPLKEENKPLRFVRL